MRQIRQQLDDSIPALTSPNVFACHCVVDAIANSLKVGVLALNEEFEFGLHTLYSQDESQFFTVQIEGLTANPSYGVTLPLVDV